MYIDWLYFKIIFIKIRTLQNVTCLIHGYLFFLITRIMKILKRRSMKSVGKMGNTQENVDLAERMPVSWSAEPIPNLVSYKKLRSHLIGIVLWLCAYLLTDRWLEHCNFGFKHILSTCVYRESSSNCSPE